jgi:glycolate oxidase subunit GlcD
VPDSHDNLEQLAHLLGSDGLMTDPAARLVYSRDASHMTMGRPLAVALPADAATLRAVVRHCADHGLTVVTRGTGTGLSGGAVPNEGAIVLATARLNGIHTVDVPGRRVRCQVGVLNDRVSAHAAPSALHFAPDPSSQSAASIGGNIAENAGGPHCLRHGVTLQHLLRLEWCDVRGRELVTSRGLPCERGIDLTSLLCGSEGTLGVVTAADLRLVPNPSSVATLAAFFPDLNEATGSVVSLLGAGLMPVAIEIVDQPMLEAVEAAFGFGFPTDVAAAMILEFAGSPEETAEDSHRAKELLAAAGAREVRLAEDEATRRELWKCRKKAFGAVGRLAPSYVTMDVVVPLGELPELVREIQVIKNKYGVEIATAFHAGDGNLHPGVHYDDRDPEQCRAAHAAADEIMQAALAKGGSVTGEHGVGIEKLHAMPWQIDPVALDVMWSIRRAFDPAELLNPGKALSPPDSPCAPAPPVPSGSTFRWESLTVTASADVSLADLQAEALARGLWLPTGLAAAAETTGRSSAGLGGDRTVGSLVDHILLGPSLLSSSVARDSLLELWAEMGDGGVLHAGAPVVKNVAGYQLAQMICGSGGVLAVPRAATFQLRPAPETIALWRFDGPIDRESTTGALAPLLRLLAAREAALGSPTCVLDTAGPESEGSLFVLAGGRDRAWDLGALDRGLRAAAESAGLHGSVHERSDFASWAQLLTRLPDWARAGAHWTVSTAIPDARQEASPIPLGPSGRVIWQATPRLTWTPDLPLPSNGWHVDTCYDDGRATALPEPAAGVPRDLLRSLKAIFDPEQRLGGPAWLIGDTDD